MSTRRTLTGLVTAATAAATLVGLSMLGSPASAKNEAIHFKMVRSSAAFGAGCLAHAHAKVTVVSQRQNQKMTIHAKGLPKNTDFDLFVTQLPNAPFGLAWYQSDLETNSKGRAEVVVRGRFNIETFAVATGVGAAPQPHHAADSAENPAFKPLHTFHLGLWFNSPKDAKKAGCPDTTTPFNGDHNAGVQAMSTRLASDLHGPLGRLGD